MVNHNGPCLYTPTSKRLAVLPMVANHRRP